MAPSKDGEGFSTATGEVFNDKGWMIQNARGYRIHEEPYSTPRKLRIIHIGAGASGITFSKFAEDRLQNVELQIYEKNHDVGGTWLENRCVGMHRENPNPRRLTPTLLKISWLRLRHTFRKLSIHLG